jgi:hypothetical protein
VEEVVVVVGAGTRVTTGTAAGALERVVVGAVLPAVARAVAAEVGRAAAGTGAVSGTITGSMYGSGVGVGLGRGRDSRLSFLAKSEAGGKACNEAAGKSQTTTQMI